MLNEDDQLKVISTFFAQKASLNRSGMLEYGLNTEKKQDSEKKNSDGMNVDFIERFDSRGKKIKIKVGKIAHPPL